MAKSHIKDYTEMDEEDSNFEDSDYSSDEDSTYTVHLDKAQSKFSKLTLKNKPKSNSRDDDEMEMSSQKVDKEEMKSLEQVQKIIDCGQVEKLKVEQCKVYLRRHGLRLTGKKDILIQRIKEHVEIVDGRGEEKYPPSSFVMNCKGDACLGDIVMFEQTVYEGFNIASRSATGPPCGKRTIAGRIVNESYGAAKQQHTFTVEVLWSKGDKPLPPLHPLLIKGRNLYRLETRRQRWEDEGERQRVLNEKHSRGSVARSNREARIQVKMAKKTLTGMRAKPKGENNSLHPKEQGTEKLANKVPQEHIAARKTQQKQARQDTTDAILKESKENSNPEAPRYQPARHVKPNMVAPALHEESRPEVSLKYKAQSSYPLHGPQPLQQAKSSVRFPLAYKKGSCQGNVEFIDPNQQTRPNDRYQHDAVYKPQPFPQKIPGILPFHLRQETRAYSSECENIMTSHLRNQPFPDNFVYPQNNYYSTVRLHDTNRRMPYSSPGRNPPRDSLMSANYMNSTCAWERPVQTRQQLCRHYPRGKCHYGNRCKFLHESNRNYH